MSKQLPKIANFRNRIVGSGVEPVDQLVANPENWRIHPEHQQHALDGAIDEIGFARSILVNKTTGNVIDGHARITLAMRSGVKELPVEYVELTEDEERKALLFIDPIAAMAATDRQKLSEIMQRVSTEDERVREMISQIADEERLIDNLKVPKDAKPNPRKLPLDVIYTAGGNGVPTDEPSHVMTHCCLAVASGMLYGVQSGKTKGDHPTCGDVCVVSLYKDSHRVQFIDNNFYAYDHENHVASVKKWSPKYCTTRDIMTKTQCGEAGIEYYEFEHIMEMAEEMSEICENVIVIPKYDILDKIPEKFMLGYSVPTSHGGTPLPVEAFKGRRVHLLGGSWKAQLAHMAVLGDDVVSLDNNYIMKQAKFGSFVYPDGSDGQISENLGLPQVINPMYVALAISCGNIGAKVNELYSGVGEPAEKDKTE